MSNIDLSNLVIKKVVSVISGYNQTGARGKRQDRSHWAILMKYEGQTLYTASGKNILSNASHIVILPKGCTYQWECSEAGGYYSIEFEADKSFDTPFSFVIKGGDKILDAMRALEHKRSSNPDMMEIEGVRDAYSILIMLIQSAHVPYTSSEKQRKIQPALDYIHANYNKRIDNDTLAQLVGVSTVYFRRLFRESVGTSPIVYAHELRIKRAKELLGGDYDSLSDIAQSLGYSGIYDFSRDFKSHVGVSPSKYN